MSFIRRLLSADSDEQTAELKRATRKVSELTQNELRLSALLESQGRHLEEARDRIAELTRQVSEDVARSSEINRLAARESQLNALLKSEGTLLSEARVRISDLTRQLGEDREIGAEISRLRLREETLRKINRRLKSELDSSANLALNLQQREAQYEASLIAQEKLGKTLDRTRDKLSATELELADLETLRSENEELRRGLRNARARERRAKQQVELNTLQIVTLEKKRTRLAARYIKHRTDKAGLIAELRNEISRLKSEKRDLLKHIKIPDSTESKAEIERIPGQSASRPELNNPPQAELTNQYSDIETLDWLPEGNYDAPADDQSVGERALAAQRAIAAHTPVDSSADW